MLKRMKYAIVEIYHVLCHYEYVKLISNEINVTKEYLRINYSL